MKRKIRNGQVWQDCYGREWKVEAHDEYAENCRMVLLSCGRYTFYSDNFIRSYFKYVRKEK